MGTYQLSMVATFIGYLILLLVIGYLGDRKHSRSFAGFISADKSLGAWTTALSSAASAESAWAILGLSGLGYWFGLPALWAAAGCVLGFIANGLFVIRQLRSQADRLNAVTLSDYIEARLGDDTRILRKVSAVIITFFLGVYVVAQFTGAGRLLADMNVLGPDTSYETGVIIGATVVGIYIFMGGYAAVCWTDSLQGIMMLFVMVGMPAYAVAVAGGPGEVWETLQAQQALFPSSDLLAWGTGGFILSQLAVGLGYQGMPHMVIRYITVRDDREARRAGYISVAWGAVALFGSALLGVVCRGLYPLDTALCIDAGMCNPCQKAAEGIISLFATRELHPIVAGLVLAAVSAAIMSTADSQLIYAATALVNDLWLRIRPSRLSQRGLVWSTRAVIAVITIIAAVIAMQEIKLIYTFVLFAWGALGAAFTPIVLLSLYWKRFTRWGALTSMILGPATVIVWHLPPVSGVLSGLDGTLYSGVFELIPACLVSVVGAVVVSLMTQGSRGEIGAE